MYDRYHTIEFLNKIPLAAPATYNEALAQVVPGEDPETFFEKDPSGASDILPVIQSLMDLPTKPRFPTNSEPAGLPSFETSQPMREGVD